MTSPPPFPHRRHGLSLRVPPVALVALFAFAMYMLPGIAVITFSGAGILAGLLAVAGAAFCMAGVLAFRRARTTVNPLDPSHSTALVTAGVYRWTRNPMYLGFALLLLALAVWWGKLSALLLVPLFMGYLQRFQIQPEEEALRARFGAAFDAYCLQVRRWL